MKLTSVIASVICCTASTLIYAQQEHTKTCSDTPAPLLKVADFDGSGIVDTHDLKSIGKAFRNFLQTGEYYSIYDRNADGEISGRDIALTARDLGKESDLTDQQLAQLYHELKALQNINVTNELYELGFEPITSSLAGHGVHWNNMSSTMDVSGLNIPEDNSAVKGIYYSKGAIPLFNDSSSPSGYSTLDYPQPGGAWMYERVQAFAGHPPNLFPESNEESWHTHAGLCVTLQDNGSGPQIELDQHTSYMECQVIPSLRKINIDGVEQNAWFNIWMLHIWMFDLNPSGLFAGTHPCLDMHAPLENEINDDREIPIFFMHHE